MKSGQIQVPWVLLTRVLYSKSFQLSEPHLPILGVGMRLPLSVGITTLHLNSICLQPALVAPFSSPTATLSELVTSGGEACSQVKTKHYNNGTDTLSGNISHIFPRHTSPCRESHQLREKTDPEAPPVFRPCNL